MAITARLSLALHQALGDESANDLVTWMELVESNRLVFRETMGAFGARMDAGFAESTLALEKRLRADREAADARFAKWNEQADARFAKIDQRFEKIDERFVKLDERLARLEATMERRFADLLKWSFVFWVGAVGAIAVLAGVLR